jgi:hypothetical protein
MGPADIEELVFGRLMSAPLGTVFLSGLGQHEIEEAAKGFFAKTEAGHRSIPLNSDGLAALARLRSRAESSSSHASAHLRSLNNT